MARNRDIGTVKDWASAWCARMLGTVLLLACMGGGSAAAQRRMTGGWAADGFTQWYAEF